MPPAPGDQPAAQLEQPTSGPLTTDQPLGPPISRQIIVLSLIAVAVGLLAGAGATVFVTVEHHLQTLLWTDIPEALGHEQAPAWLVVILLVTGALITFLAEKLPGEGGHTPLHGFGIDIGPREILSVTIAALGSLSFGAVLGPEAPLMAIGTALGALAFRDPSKPIRQVMMIVGAMAAIGAIFGNPLVTCVLMLEFAMLAGARMATPLVLMPALAGMAASYVLQVGVEQWSGLGEAQLAVPDLAPYPEVQFADLAVSVPLAIVVGVAAMAARLGALRVAALAARSRLGTMVGGAVVVALAAIAVDAITGGGLELVLFSGQSAMPDYLALTSLGTALVVLAGKFIGYTASLGSGFRGGPIFPAVAIGVILATSATLLVGGTSTSALAAVGIAAGTAACMRMPFTALLLGVMLTYPAGGATTIMAIIGTIVGLATRLAGERFAPVLAPQQH
jgi:H+/Cl- antiporter ClcA